MDQMTNRPDRPLNEADVRRIVREEISRAFGMLAREAFSLDMPYETAELDSRALENIRAAAEGVMGRMTCPHDTFVSWHNGQDPRCTRCGEPEPEPVNPFEDKEGSRG